MCDPGRLLAILYVSFRMVHMGFCVDFFAISVWMVSAFFEMRARTMPGLYGISFLSGFVLFGPYS